VAIAYGKRFVIGNLIGLVCVVGIWFALDRTLFEHMRRCQVSDAIRLRIGHLVLATPAGLDDGEWAAAVRWTDNLHGNSMLQFHATLSDLKQLEADIASRQKSDVDMETIEWIWDRYAELTPSGQRYNERFRSTMYEHMESARANGDPYGDYKSYRDWVSR
jgi:hypothetical protein